MRYRLQTKEPISRKSRCGDTTSDPVRTWRWRDIATSDDKAALEKIMPPNSNEYRVEDTRPYGNF